MYLVKSLLLFWVVMNSTYRLSPPSSASRASFSLRISSLKFSMNMRRLAASVTHWPMVASAFVAACSLAASISVFFICNPEKFKILYIMYALKLRYWHILSDNNIYCTWFKKFRFYICFDVSVHEKNRCMNNSIPRFCFMFCPIQLNNSI